MSPDIDAVNKLLKAEKVWQVVRAHMEEYHMSQGRNAKLLKQFSKNIHDSTVLRFGFGGKYA